MINTQHLEKTNKADPLPVEKLSLTTKESRNEYSLFQNASVIKTYQVYTLSPAININFVITHGLSPQNQEILATQII